MRIQFIKGLTKIYTLNFLFLCWGEIPRRGNFEKEVKLIYKFRKMNNNFGTSQNRIMDSKKGDGGSIINVVFNIYVIGSHLIMVEPFYQPLMKIKLVHST